MPNPFAPLSSPWAPKTPAPAQEPEEETSKHYSPKPTVENDPGFSVVESHKKTHTMALLTTEGFKALGGVSGIALKTFLWCCLNAYQDKHGKLCCLVGATERKRICKLTQRGEQSVYNALTELVKVGALTRFKPGHYAIKKSYGNKL